MTAGATPSIGRAKPGAEQRVDDEPLRRPEAAGPSGSIGPATAPRRRGIPSARRDRRAAPAAPAAALGRMRRRDEPIAAIVARTAQYAERPHRPAPGHRVGDRPAGILHKVDAGDPACDRRPVGLAVCCGVSSAWRLQGSDGSLWGKGRRDNSRRPDAGAGGSVFVAAVLDAAPAIRYLQHGRRV